jgi:hypothetical protein
VDQPQIIVVERGHWRGLEHAAYLSRPPAEVQESASQFPARPEVVILGQ